MLSKYQLFLSRLWQSRFPHFILIGIINTAFGYGVFALLLYLGLHYKLAILLSTCLGILFNFNTIGNFVFKQQEKSLLWRFIAIYGILYFINIYLIKGFYSVYPNYYLAGLLSTLILPILSFSLNKYFVFSWSNQTT